MRLQPILHRFITVSHHSIINKTTDLQHMENTSQFDRTATTSLLQVVVPQRRRPSSGCFGWCVQKGSFDVSEPPWADGLPHLPAVSLEISWQQVKLTCWLSTRHCPSIWTISKTVYLDLGFLPTVADPTQTPSLAQVLCIFLKSFLVQVWVL